MVAAAEAAVAARALVAVVERQAVAEGVARVPAFRLFMTWRTSFVLLTAGRGGKKGGGGAKVAIIKHRFDGVFIAKSSKDDVLVTRNLDPGNSVYGEKRIQVEVSDKGFLVNSHFLRFSWISVLSALISVCLSSRVVSVCSRWFSAHR